MTVANFLDTLINDNDLKISVQTRKNDKVVELYSTDELFGGSADSVRHKDIHYIKIENKSVYIIV